MNGTGNDPLPFIPIPENHQRKRRLMDKQFLEMWGNYLINVAKGQKQMEDMFKWMAGDYSGFPDITAMFRKAYGLEESPEDRPDFTEGWRKAGEAFEKSFREYLRMMGMVSKEEHLNLVRKYEALKAKAAEQEETIEHLRMLLNEKGMDQGEVMEEFQSIVKSQTDQFQELVKSFGKLYEQAPSAAAEKKKRAKKKS